MTLCSYCGAREATADIDGLVCCEECREAMEGER